MNRYTLLLIYLIAGNSLAKTQSASLAKNTTVFNVTNIPGSSVQNTVINQDDYITPTGDGTYSIKIPVKQDDGTYDIVDVTYTETDNNRVINIPGQGDITVVKDNEGNFSFELTPEQVKNSENVKCSANSSGKGTCTIEPFVTMVGSRVLTADKLVVDYTEGENVTVAGGTATNLKLIEPGSTTEFNKSETDAGDTSIVVKFNDANNQSFSTNVLGNEINSPSNPANLPSTIENSKNMEISLSTAKLTQTVTNPHNTSQTAVKFKVKDGGVSSNIKFENENYTKIQMDASTNSGVYYNSDPFSKNNVIIDTTSVVKTNLSIDNNPHNPKASVQFEIAEKDGEGNLSQVNIVETKEGQTTKINSSGKTYVNLSQATLVDEKTWKPVDNGAPVVFEVASDHLDVENNKNGKITTSEISGFNASGSIGDIQKSATASASLISYKEEKDGKTTIEANAKDLSYAINEDDKVKRQEAMLNHAYYKNEDYEVDLKNGAFINVTEYKNEAEASEINGKKIKSDSIMVGNDLSVTSKGNNASFSNGFNAKYTEFFDKSSNLSVSGTNGSYVTNDYKVALSDGFSFNASTDPKGEVKEASVVINKATGSQGSSRYQLTNSQTYYDANEKNKNGNSILKIYHTSEGADIYLDDKKQEVSTSGGEISAVQDEKITYGSAKFNKLTLKDNSGKKIKGVEVKSVEAVFYNDESDPNNKIRSGNLKAEAIDIDHADYKVNMMAKDENGQNKKFQVYFYEDNGVKTYRVFGEDGSLVNLEALDKNNKNVKAMFESIEYMETKEFKSIAATKLSGNVSNISANDDKVYGFSLQRVDGVESIDKNFKMISVQNGTVSRIDGNTPSSISFNNLVANQSNTDGVKQTSGSLSGTTLNLNQDGKNLSGNIGSGAFFKSTGGNSNTTFGTIGNANLTYSQGSKNGQVAGLTGSAYKEDKYQYGNIKFESLNVDSKKGDKKSNISILGAEISVAIDESSGNKVTTANGLISKASLKESDMAVDIMAKDKNGKETKFKVFLYEEGNTKQAKVFAEDGSLVKIDFNDKKNRGSVLFDTVEYLKTDKFNSLVASNISGNLETVSGNDKKLVNFSIANIQGYQAADKSLEYALINGGQAILDDKKSNTTFKFEEVQYVKELSSAGELTSIAGKNLDLKYIEFNDPIKGITSGQKLDANVKVGDVIYSQLKSSAGDVTILKANNLDLVAIDYDSMMKFQGKVGSVDYFKDAKIETIQAKDLNGFKLEDLKSGVNADINASKILRVVTKDEKGKETGSYLLLDKATLEARDPKNGLTANIKANVFEFYQDKVNNRNVILNADVKGSVKLDKTKSPVAAQVNFALKGKNLTTESYKHVTNDGNTIENYFAIKAIDDQGGLEHLKLEAGPSFLKDAISLEAKGKEGGGKSLSFTFKQDKVNGTYFIRAEFKEGDKVKVKLFPFTLESKMEGSDAVAELLLTPKGQNYLNHMQIISNVVSAHEITSWLGISDGGMIVARTGTIGGFGFEMMYQDQSHFNPGMDVNVGGNGDVAKSYGLGIYHKNDEGDKTSAGILLSGDSEIQYQTNGKGVLKIFGQDMDKDGRIPATINLYLKKEYHDGDTIYGGVFVDAASLLVDESKLSKSAAFYDGGRNSGKFGATVAYSKKLSENSRLTLTLGANDNFSKPAVCVSYTMHFGGSSPSKPAIDLTKDTMRIVNKMNETYYPESRYPSSSGPTIESAVYEVNQEMRILSDKYSEALALDKAKKALDDTLKAIKEGTLTANNVDRLFNLTDEDINKIRVFENRKYIGNGLSNKLENLQTLIKYDSSRRANYASFYKKSDELLAISKELTSKFDKEESSEIFDEYTKKVEELNSLKRAN